MYNDLFDDISQQEMRKYFINLANNIGKKRFYKKNEIITVEMDKFVGIVTKGIVSQNIISSKGQIHILHLLRSGEIFGETFKFCGGKNNISSVAKKNSEVAFINNMLLDKFLKDNPECYRYFIHSITRKYRITVLQFVGSIFNDSAGKIADALLRLSSEENSLHKNIINTSFTHEEFANDIGCSRVTVTNCLKIFLNKGIIHYEGKKIIIDNINSLKKYINTII